MRVARLLPALFLLALCLPSPALARALPAAASIGNSGEIAEGSGSQAVDLAAQVVPPSALGPHWVAINQSGAGSTEALQLFAVTYQNDIEYPAPRLASFTLVTTSLVPVQVVMDGMRTAAEASGAVLAPYRGLGDGAAFRGIVPAESGAGGIIYIFRIGNVVATVGAGSLDQPDGKGEPGSGLDPALLAELDAQALEFARLQESLLRQ